MEDYSVYMRSSDANRKLSHTGSITSNTSRVRSPLPVSSADAPLSSSMVSETLGDQFTPAPDVSEEDVTDFVQQVNAKYKSVRTLF